ncbi:recombinase family protein, partial [Rhodococcus sp. IC4_135]|nr:recombinase family protein [Rhodococcus sp. IC4_135]
MAVIGYARVSTTEQNAQLQLDALKAAGAARIFTDHGVSGSKTARPELDACIDHLREGDVLTVWKLDRLGRNTVHVLQLIEELTEHGIGFRSVTEGLHTDGPMGKAMLTIMAAFAQLERVSMRKSSSSKSGCINDEQPVVAQQCPDHVHSSTRQGDNRLN